MILPIAGTRAMSANVWIDPLGRLWLFWGQSEGLQDGRFGVWTVVCGDPDAAKPKWSAPRRIGDGIMLNKPTVLTSGDWLLTSSVWKADNSIKVYASTNQGKTFQLRGTANIEDAKTRGPDEPMIVERKDGSLWMMVRCQGLAETISLDQGRTWTSVKRIALPHPTARFFLRRLNSGALLLVKHGPLDERVKREQLTAFISDDDGQTWQGGLMLDEREDLADDLGVGDVGCYGQRLLKTPRIDQLATKGMRFTEHYSGAAMCAPTRSCLMTGQHTGHTRVRKNGHGPLLPEDLTIAEVLKSAGCHTAAIGKWGIGEAGTTGVPWQQGFDLFFGYLNQTDAHHHYPPFPWRNDRKDLYPDNSEERTHYSERDSNSPLDRQLECA